MSDLARWRVAEVERRRHHVAWLMGMWGSTAVPDGAIERLVRARFGVLSAERAERELKAATIHGLKPTPEAWQQFSVLVKANRGVLRAYQELNNATAFLAKEVRAALLAKASPDLLDGAAFGRLQSFDAIEGLLERNRLGERMARQLQGDRQIASVVDGVRFVEVVCRERVSLDHLRLELAMLAREETWRSMEFPGGVADECAAGNWIRLKFDGPADPETVRMAEAFGFRFLEGRPYWQAERSDRIRAVTYALTLVRWGDANAAEPGAAQKPGAGSAERPQLPEEPGHGPNVGI